MHTNNYTISYVDPVQNKDQSITFVTVDKSTNIVTIYCVSSQRCKFRHLHYNIRHYLSNMSGSNYTIRGFLPKRGWLDELKYLRSKSTDIRLLVHLSALSQQSKFNVTNARGHYGYIYIDKHYVILASYDLRSTTHLSPKDYNGMSYGPVIAKGYHDNIIFIPFNF